MGNLGQVGHEHLVGDGLTQGDGQLHRCFAEAFGVEHRLHRDNLRLGVRHLDTDGSLTRDGCDDTNAQSRQTQGDVVFEVANLRDAHTLGGCYLVERDGGSHGGVDGAYLHAEVVEHLDDAVHVRPLLILVDGGSFVGVVFLQQVERRELILEPRHAWIDGYRKVGLLVERFAAGLLFAGASLYMQLNVVVLRCVFYRFRRVKSTTAAFLVEHQFDVGLAFPFLLFDGGHDDCRLNGLSGLLGCGRFGCWVVCLLLVVGDDKLHLVGECADGVEHASHHVDGLRAEVGQEDEGHQGQDSRQTGCADDVVEPLAAVQSVVAAGIEHLVAHDRSEELGERHRAPDHDDDDGHEPLQQVHLRVDTHHLQSGENHEQRDEEGRQPEAACHEEPRKQRPHRAAAVLEVAVGVEPFAGSKVQDEALVGLSRREVRHEGDGDVHRQQQEDKSEDEVEDVVLEDILDAESLAERFALLGLFFLCHVCCYCLFELQK